MFTTFLSSLLILFASVTFARPAPRFLELSRRAIPNEGGMFVPHPRPGKPINLPPSSSSTTSPVFEPTKTPIKIKVVKNPKVTKIPNPKKGNK
ncbi:hypothetical protein JCM5353_007355 [Sporobolomyces roseus]